MLFGDAPAIRPPSHRWGCVSRSARPGCEKTWENYFGWLGLLSCTANLWLAITPLNSKIHLIFKLVVGYPWYLEHVAIRNPISKNAIETTKRIGYKKKRPLYNINDAHESASITLWWKRFLNDPTLIVTIMSRHTGQCKLKIFETHLIAQPVTKGRENRLKLNTEPICRYHLCLPEGVQYKIQHGPTNPYISQHAIS